MESILGIEWRVGTEVASDCRIFGKGWSKCRIEEVGDTATEIEKMMI
jgi:hypothetical protein